MQMQVSGTLAEGDGIDTVTACDPPDQLGGPLHHHPPIAGFSSVKLDGAGTMSPCIKQAPTGQWRRLRMMSKKPEFTAPDLMGSQLGSISVKGTDGAGCVSLRKNHGHRGAT